MTELVAGATAPAFTLPRLGGGEVRVPSARLTLLVFAKSSCPTCRWALPYFQALHERTENGALAVIGVVQDDVATEQAFAEELALTYPIALEGSPWDLAVAYGVTTVPTFFLLDESGTVRLNSPGFSRDDLLEVARAAAELDGGDPASPFPEGEEIPAFRPG